MQYAAYVHEAFCLVPKCHFKRNVYTCDLETIKEKQFFCELIPSEANRHSDVCR